MRIDKKNIYNCCNTDDAYTSTRFYSYESNGIYTAQGANDGGVLDCRISEKIIRDVLKELQELIDGRDA